MITTILLLSGTHILGSILDPSLVLFIVISWIQWSLSSVLGALDSFSLRNCRCDGGRQINLINVTFVFHSFSFQWWWADQSYRREFCFYPISFQNQPIVPPWSSQAVLKLEHKSSQVREQWNNPVLSSPSPRPSYIHGSPSQSLIINDYQIPNVLMESPEEMEEVLADLRRNAEARAKTMARYQDFSDI